MKKQILTRKKKTTTKKEIQRSQKKVLSKNDILFVSRYGERVDTWLSKSHGEIRVGSNPTSGIHFF